MKPSFAASYSRTAASLGMVDRGRASWISYALAALLAGAVVAAILVVGPASGASSTQTRFVTAQRGVVQSTVSGSGSVAAWSELDLGFKTAGTVTHIYVKQGQQVAQGQLIATLDPHSAEVTLEQAKANLQSAEAALAREEETDGEASSSSSSNSPTANAAGTGTKATATIAAAQGTTPSQSEAPPSSQTTPTTTQTTAPSTTTPTTAPVTTTSPAAEPQKTAKKNAASEAQKAAEGSSSSSSASSELSSATREANIASARAAVKSDRLTVENDERSVADTRLTAPQSGTIVSLGGEVGETVSGGGTSRASSESSESSSGSGGGGLGGSNPSSNSSSSSSESSSSSSAFAVLSDLSSMKLVVPLSESEVGSVRRGQTATVTVEALKGKKLAAHVSEVAATPTSNSGVVSYDVTFALDQLAEGLKAGMSATAEVVVQQAEGVNVPSSAITGGTVTVLEGGKQVRRPVTTGLAGDSTTIVLSGVKAGERVALPQATSGGGANLLSRLGSRTGGKGSLGGGLGGGFAGGGLAGGGPPRIVGGAGPGG